jgi:hypothetical protein
VHVPTVTPDCTVTVHFCQSLVVVSTDAPPGQEETMLKATVERLQQELEDIRRHRREVNRLGVRARRYLRRVELRWSLICFFHKLFPPRLVS